MKQSRISVAIDNDLLEWIDSLSIARHKRSEIINELLRERKDSEQTTRSGADLPGGDARIVSGVA